MFLAQATAKHKPPPPCTIKTQTPAQKRLPKEKYELQNEEELSVAMVKKKPGYSNDKDKESRPYAYGLSSNVGLRRHGNAIRHYCRANPDIADN